VGEKRDALIIASYEYEDSGLKQLVAPSQDAEDLARVLKNPEIGNFNVHIILNGRSADLNEQIETFFTDRARDDILLLYFSCHGIKDKYGRLYFAAINTKRKLLGSTAIASSFINEMMRNSRSRSKILLLDCCYAGAFARGMAAKADKSVGTRERFKQSNGSVVLTASDEMQYSFEDDMLSGAAIRSVFTRNLVRGLETGEADKDRDGFISMQELYEYTYKRVVDENPAQQPELWVLGMQGNFIIAKNPVPIAVDSLSWDTTRIHELNRELQFSAPNLDENDWRILLKAIRRGKLLPIVGPGASQGTIPFDHVIASQWARQHQYSKNDWWDLSKMAQFLAKTFNSIYPRALLTKQLADASASESTQPDELYSILATLPLPVYINTNYDDRLLKALKAHNKEPRVEFCRWNNKILHDPTVEDIDPTSTNPLVFHLFGYSEVPESMVLTEDDYTEYSWNLSRDPSLLPPRVQEALVGSILLFIGCPSTNIKFQTISRTLNGFIRRNYLHKLKGGIGSDIRNFKQELRRRWTACDGN